MNQQDMKPDVSQDFWKLGDKAKLLTGGPAMTVTSVGVALLECSWFHGTELKKDWFPPESIEADD
ncbi:DUF2158 domain-containing protein [Paucibacter soli]|uniref:DUF2158 domain-containing protein n=1 Tax=Paucibacter soli TaxID=3133433 RepID=UPI00309ADA38